MKKTNYHCLLVKISALIVFFMGLILNSNEKTLAKEMIFSKTNKITFLVIEDGGAIFPEVVHIKTVVTEKEKYDSDKKKYKFYKRSFWFSVEIDGDYAKPDFDLVYRDRHFVDGAQVHYFSWERKPSIFPICDHFGYYESERNVYYTKKETKGLTCEYKYLLKCPGAVVPTKYVTNKHSLSDV